MVRAFLAIDLPLELKRELYSLSQMSLPEGLKGKGVEEENFHLTLHFFGNIPDNLVEKIGRSLQKLFGVLTPFSLTLDKPGFFPERGTPRVLWIGLKDVAGELKMLNKKLQATLKQLKLERKERFHPHITLLRIKEFKDPEAFQAYFRKLLNEAKRIEGMTFHVKEVTLFKSELTPKGPVYSPLKTFPLEGGAE